MHRDLVDMLQCPSCGSTLSWQVQQVERHQILEGEARCTNCSATYPVKDGIGIFLTPDLPREDLWEAVDSHLTRFLKERPDIEEKLLGSPLQSLSPADQHFRGMVLAERGLYREAEEAFAQASVGIYTDEYRRGSRAQIDFVIHRLKHRFLGGEGLVVDLASGMCTLVDAILKETSGIRTVISDFSPRVLRRQKAYYRWCGLADRTEFLAFDVRKMPFKNNSISALTTYVGFQNIQYGANETVKEVARVLSGELLAVCLFHPEHDIESREYLRNYGLEELAFKASALDALSRAGLDAGVENAIAVRALPTPKSCLIEGAGIDALPLKETVLEWCTVVVKRKQQLRQVDRSKIQD